jgi:hypothetical protein
MSEEEGVTPRGRISAACAAGGVALVLAAGFLPEGPAAATALVAGIGLLAVSHVLTPCRDQITRWWRARLQKHSPPWL